MTVSNEGNLCFVDSRLAPKSVDFAGAVKEAFSKYATFKGRASRSEYWYFILFYILLLVATVVFSALDPTGIVIVVGLLSWFAMFVPILSAMVRRLHDTGKSGLWYWVSLIPFGGIALLVFLSQEGESIDNDYGPAQSI